MSIPRRKEPMQNLIHELRLHNLHQDNLVSGRIHPVEEPDEAQYDTDTIVARQITNGASLYNRERDLPKLFSRNRWEGKSSTEIVALLRSAVSGGSKALAANHWSADTNRLLALRMALAAERRVAEWEEEGE